MMEIVLIVLVAVAAYLIGSISSAILIGRVVSGDDIRKHGSGNAGATNALRTYGKKVAILVLVCDCLKAVVAMVIALLIGKFLIPERQDILLYVAGIGAVLGHNFPLYFNFKGGKGVVVSTTAIFFADWRIALSVLVIAILIMALTRYVSLGSVLGSVLFAALVLVFHFGDWYMTVYAIILAALLIYMHRGNIHRLLSGTENKLGSKK